MFLICRFNTNLIYNPFLILVPFCILQLFIFSSFDYTKIPFEFIFPNAISPNSSNLIQIIPPNSTIQPPAVIVEVNGGIGNQLFQYACSYALAKRKKWPIYIRNGKENSRNFESTSRYFALDQFNIPLNLINPYTYPTSESSEILSVFEDGLLKDEYNKSFNFLKIGDYCQSELYWTEYKTDIRDMFQIRPESINLTKISGVLEKIKSSDSIALHVRRNDKVGPHFIPMSFHRRAVHKMAKILNSRGSQNPIFFVFSDDTNYSRDSFNEFYGKYEFVHVSEQWNTTSIEDFYLMRQCHHFISPCSTFSWWTAYLGNYPDKIIISSTFNPTFYWAIDSDFVRNLYGQMHHRKEWIVLNPFTGGLTVDT